MSYYTDSPESYTIRAALIFIAIAAVSAAGCSISSSSRNSENSNSGIEDTAIEYTKIRLVATLQADARIALEFQVLGTHTDWRTIKRAVVATPELGKCYLTSEADVIGWPRKDNRVTQSRASLCIRDDGGWNLAIRQQPHGSTLGYILSPKSLVTSPRESVRYVGRAYTPTEERKTRSDAATRMAALNPPRKTPRHAPTVSTESGSSSNTARLTTGRFSTSSSPARGTRVTRIIDGDTIEVRDCAYCSTYRIRLASVWAPETNERGGSTATTRLRNLIPPGTIVTFTQTQRDSYGRKVGYVSVSGTSVNSRMRSYGYTSDRSYPKASNTSRSSSSSSNSSCDTSQRTYRGSPGYHPSQDRDKDGIGCECGCRRR